MDGTVIDDPQRVDLTQVEQAADAPGPYLAGVRSQGRILVTGGGGFIGRRLMTALAGIGCDVHQIRDRGDCDLHQSSALEDRLNRIRPRVIVHLAASPDDGSDGPTLCATQRGTVDATLSVVRAARSSPDEIRVVHAGSYKQYGDVPLPFREAGPTEPWNDYGRAKNVSEQIVRSAHGHGFSAVCLRIGPIFGPGQAGMQLVPSLITSITSRASEVVVGDRIWDPLFLDDLVGAICCAITSPVSRTPAVFNVSGGRPVSPLEVAGMIANELGVDIGDRVSPIERIGMPCLGDISLAEAGLGWRPQLSLEEGIGRTVKYMVAEQGLSSCVS